MKHADKELTLETREYFKAIYPDWYWIGELQADDLKLIEECGARRERNGNKRGWTNLAKNPGSDDIHGFAGEYALFLIYNSQVNRVEINARDVEQAIADNGAFLESKANRYGGRGPWDLCVNENQLKLDRIYSLTLTALYPKWLVNVGWATGHDIKSKAELMKHSTTGHWFYRLQRKHLYAPMSLYDELDKRNYELREA